MKYVLLKLSHLLHKMETRKAIGDQLASQRVVEIKQAIAILKEQQHDKKN